MSSITGDLRYALRALGSHPGFTALAVASLALGLGVNTALFSLVDQVLLWSIPARDPGRLVNLAGGRAGTYPFFREYRDRNQVFSGLLAASHPDILGVRPQDAPAVELAHVSYISGGYFATLGVGAAAGRVIVASDDRAPGGSPVVVLSYGYWQRRFAGDLHAIGRKFAVNGYPLEIAGIAEKGFEGLFQGHPTEAFVPLTMFPLLTPSAVRVWNTPNMDWLFVMGRLKPGLSLEQAQAGMRVLWPQVMEAVNDAMVKSGGRKRTYKDEEQIVLEPGGHGLAGRPSATLDPLQALLFATGLVLLIACANVANLMLERAAGRRKEIAVRLALGATRGRLIRQLLTESLALASLGGLAGLALAWWGVWALARSGIVDSALRFRPSLAVAAFSLGATLLTTLAAGLAPAFRATRLDLAQAAKDSGGAASPGGSRLRLGKLLIAGQVALSLVLLVGAGLFLRTLRNLERVDMGFARENILIADVDPSDQGYQGHRLRTFYDDLLERARRLPGVRSAALVAMPPMGNFARSSSFAAEGYTPKPGERLIEFSNPVSSGYFTTLGIPMLLGRDFRAQDEPAVTPEGGILAALGHHSGGGDDSNVVKDAGRVCILNESLARKLFGGSPLGRHLSFDDPYNAEGAMEVVGVVKDTRQFSLREAEDHGMVYQPSWGRGAEPRWLGLRVAGDPAPVVAALRRELRALDSNVPLLRTRTIEEYVNANLRRERLIAYLSSLFGLLALGLASVGLYGVMAYAVTQRTRELGIRMALGASRGDVMALILRESLVPVACGAAAGLAGALALTRLVAGFLFGVAPGDPLSIALAVAALLVVALVAAALPARRASRVEPLTALRYE